MTKSAIGIRVKKAVEGYDLGTSKFFGTPTIPLIWENDFYEDEIFLCQIRLSDIAPFDPHNQLPHSGYLYIFLHTENGNYELRADVRYAAEEPELALDDFNAAVEGYESYNQAYLMEFYEADESSTATRLLGVPSDWPYEEDPPKLLMQFDPLDSEMGFLDYIDGFLYFFFGKDGSDLSEAWLKEEYT